MKNRKNRLSLGRETLRSLNEEQMKGAAGGATADRSVCTSGYYGTANATVCYPNLGYINLWQYNFYIMP